MIFEKNIVKKMWFALTPWLLLPLISAESWRWPEGKEERKQEVKIDTKLRFLDDGKSVTAQTTSVVHIPRHPEDPAFHQPVDTQGFYNRPGGNGRFPVRVQTHEATTYRVDPQHMYTVTTYRPRTNLGYHNDETLEPIQYCKCVSTPDCNPRPDPGHACGPGQFLCCFKRPNKHQASNPEYFNEVEDERPMLLPGRQTFSGPFPHPSSSHLDDPFDQPNSHTHDNKPDVLIGPQGPTGQVGPPKRPPNREPVGSKQLPLSRPVLVGPNGPTGIIGPAPVNQNNPKDPRASSSAQRGVLVGPGGPTGVIGPYGQQRPVLVGPGGPTGVIGPGRRGQDYNRGVLVGPGGPTGIIGPGYSRRPAGFGLLVGPGGPTGTIGPGRQLLVGPGGPSGTVGPRRYFGD